jgi:hypothetical protein
MNNFNQTIEPEAQRGLAMKSNWNPRIWPLKWRPRRASAVFSAMALFFSALFLVAIGPHCSADPKPVNKENTMIIHHKYFQFKVPAGFEDKTSYGFSGPNKMDLIEMHFVQSEENRDLRSFIDEDKEKVKDYFKGEMKVKKDFKLNVGGWPAFAVWYQYEEKKKSISDFTIAAQESPRLIFAVRYAGEHANTKELGYIMSSVRPIGDKPGNPPAKGYERREAGRICIDLPATWTGPPSYLLFSKDGQLKIELNIIPVNQKEEFHELSYIQKSEEADGNKIKDQKRERVTVKSGQAGQQFKYLLDDSEHPYNPTITAVQRVFIELGAVELHIWAKTNPDLRDQMNAAFAELITGIEVVK